MENAVGGGETILIPLEITFPAADATGTATISGSAQAIGADTVSITLNFTNNVAGSDLTDSSEVFILNAGQRVHYTNTLTPSRGSFMNTGDLTITESSAVVAFGISEAGGGSLNISTAIIAPLSDVTIPIVLAGSTTQEPYVATVNITETLPFGRIINNTLSQRFGITDTNVVFSNITVTPTEGGIDYPNSTTFTIVGGSASNYSYSSGSVTFDLTISLPTFTTLFPIGNVALSCSITGIAPAERNAVSSKVSPRTIYAPANGGTYGVNVTADGTWSFPGNLGGNESIADQFWSISESINQGRRGGAFTVTIPANTSGSSRSFTRTLVAGTSAAGTAVINGLSVQQSAQNQIESSDVVSISVDLGGTAGSTTGVLYIT